MKVHALSRRMSRQLERICSAVQKSRRISFLFRLSNERLRVSSNILRLWHILFNHCAAHPNNIAAPPPICLLACQSAVPDDTIGLSFVPPPTPSLPHSHPCFETMGELCPEVTAEGCCCKARHASPAPSSRYRSPELDEPPQPFGGLVRGNIYTPRCNKKTMITKPKKILLRSRLFN